MLEQWRGNDDGAVVAALDRGVFDVRVNRHCEVGWKRPRSGGPDHDGCNCVLQVELCACVVAELELNVDRNAGVVAVFDFRFCEGSCVRDRPVDRLLGAVNEFLLHKAGECFELSGFVFGVDGPVFVVPITEHTEALELTSLDLAELVGELGAGFTHFEWCVVGAASFLQLAGNFLLNWQTVTVPTRDVGSVVALHPLEA